jgi:CRP-like cAMP-binding protein
MTEQTKTTRHPCDNQILIKLSEEDYALLQPHLEPVKLTLGDVIYHPDEAIKYIYFPDCSMVSVIATTPDGQAAEVGVVGREGIVGVNVLLGADSTPNQSIVQLPGSALRIKAKIITAHFDNSASMRKLFLLHVNALIMQISQTALCNRLHSIEQRLTRWLLLCHDRSDSDTLPLTQEFLSIMLGSNRPTVTQTALILQAAGLIKYSRGKITIIDRQAIEDFACDCYLVVKPE